MTIGKEAYCTLSEYERLMPWERDLYLDLVIERINKASVGSKVNKDDVVSDFEEFNG
jgi:hypothetical protein